MIKKMGVKNWFSLTRLEAALWLLVLLSAGLVTAQEVGDRQESVRIAAAPHVTDASLTAAYQKNAQTAGRRFDHKMVVVTGTVAGMDEGLFGDGCIHMGGAVVCDVGGHFGGTGWGQHVAVVGICEGMDANGNLNLNECRVFKP